MFPPPMTTQIWTPSSWISFTCLQVRSRASASIGSPVFSPRRSSPESLRMMRLYFTLGSTGRGACMGSNETVGQIGRQLPSVNGLDYAFDAPSPGSNPGRAASFGPPNGQDLSKALSDVAPNEEASTPSEVCHPLCGE